jgi:hypothetical protein
LRTDRGPYLIASGGRRCRKRAPSCKTSISRKQTWPNSDGRQTSSKSVSSRLLRPRSPRVTPTYEFLQIPSESCQLCFFENSAKEFLNHPSEQKNLAMLFELNERTVRKNLLHGPQ